MRGFDSVEVGEARLLEGGGIEAAFSVPEGSPYFNLHFEGFKLLPAVAAIDIVMNLLAASRGREYSLLCVKGCKFVSPLRPRDKCVASIFLDGDILSFTISREGGERLSAGKLKVAEDEKGSPDSCI